MVKIPTADCENSPYCIENNFGMNCINGSCTGNNKITILCLKLINE